MAGYGEYEDLGYGDKLPNDGFLGMLMQMTLPISVEDVKREVKILRTLSGHENVVQFYAAFEDDDLVYIVME